MKSKFYKLYILVMESLLKESVISSLTSTKINDIDEFKNLINSEKFKYFTKIKNETKNRLDINVKTTIISDLLNEILDNNDTNISILNRNDIIEIKLSNTNKIIRLRGSVSGFSRDGSAKLRTDLYESIIALSVNRLKNKEDILFSNNSLLNDDINYVINNLDLSITPENILNTLEYYQNTIIKAPGIIVEFINSINPNLICYHTKFKNKIDINILNVSKICGFEKDKINPGDIWLIDVNQLKKINKSFSEINELETVVEKFNDLFNKKELMGISLKQFHDDGKLKIVQDNLNIENASSFNPDNFEGVECNLSNNTGNNYVYFKFNDIDDKTYYGIEGRIGGNSTGSESITLEGKEGAVRLGKARSLLSHLIGISNCSEFMKKPLKALMNINSIENIRSDIVCDHNKLEYLLYGGNNPPYESRNNERVGRDRALLAILLYCYNNGNGERYKENLLTFLSRTLTIPIKGQQQLSAPYIIVY